MALLRKFAKHDRKTQTVDLAAKLDRVATVVGLVDKR
jgi:hypothetical protein